ncbi:SRPBCC domain-containing protein [Streptomyces sp. GSL17-111]|uniref:SRPBCC domain-containing protein n=1 Tax=Streptomyces sp. GSL17-111 TaxID=3121596 RepID=UPI0030F43FCB
MPAGLTQGAGWEVGVSRTIPLPPATVWDLISSEEGLALWPGPGARLAPEKGTQYTTTEGTTGEVRSYRPGDRIRLTYRPHGDDHHTTFQLDISAAPRGKAVLRSGREGLRGAEECPAAA